ncbi:MAG: hypothetical protein EHM35_20490, partial [Planctomycetaceae bacterium]
MTKSRQRTQHEDGNAMTITPDQMRFTFSDTIAGYVTGFNRDTGVFTLRTSGGQEYPVRLKGHTYAWFVRNLGEPYHDATGQMREMLVEGTYLYVYGVFYPEG